MANYDTSIRVNTNVDNSDLLKVQKTFDDIEKSATRTKKSIEGDFSSLSDVVEDYATRLKDLRDKGFGVGDKKYDDLYIAWRNAVNAEKEYLANLDRMTEKGIADEAARAAKEQEKQAEAQRKIEEAAERNLRKETARLEKEMQIEAKLRAEATEQQRLKDLKDSATVSDKRMVQLLQRQVELKNYLNDLEKAGVTAGYSQYDNATNELQQINSEISARKKLKQTIQESRKGFQRVAESGKKCFKTIQDGTKKSNGLLATLGSRLKGIALSLLIFNWITKGFNAMVTAMKEGFQNLAQYSNDYNESMSALKSQTEQLKNGLAAAFEPVANMIIPYLTRLVSWLNTAADAVAQFFAAMQGKSTYTRAKKQVVDYAKALDTASNAAKRALASFDELNVQGKEENGSSSGVLSGADAFETVEVSNSMSQMVDAVKPFRDILASLVNDIELESLQGSFENLRQSAEPFGTYLYEGLLWFLNDILVPLSEWSIEDAVPAFLDLLSAALDLLAVLLDGLKPYGDWLWNDFLQPLAGWVADKVIDGIHFITEKLKAFSDWCKADKSHVDLMSSIILGFFAGIMTYYTAKKIVSVIGSIRDALKLFNGIVSAGISPITLAAIAIGVLAAGIIYLGSNWNKLSGAQKALTILGALAAAAIAAAVAIAVFHTAWSVGIAAAAIVGGLALLGLTAACLKSNGNTSESVANDFYNGNDFSGSPLPMLADGAVIQGGRPFAAILGDQRAGQTNVEAPLSTIEQALQNVYDKNGSVGEINLTVNLDGDSVYKTVVKRDRIYQKATGHSAFAF